MTTALDTLNQVAERHLAIARFLLEHADLLASLDFDTMRDKLGTSYQDTPYASFYTDYDEVTITVAGPEPRETMRIIRRAIGGKWDKSASSYDFKISQQRDGITITIGGARDAVCQKVVVGTHEETYPAVEARPERTETVEDVEWVCGNLLDD